MKSSCQPFLLDSICRLGLCRRIVPMLTLAIVVCGSLDLAAQSTYRPTHPLVRSTMAPGAIAAARLLSDPRLAEYYQPVQVTVPDGASIGFWAEGAFTLAPSRRATAGLIVGPVYRLKISKIPGNPGLEVYPSIEMVDRLYPPAELARQHPVKIVIDTDDLKQIANRKMITKVIYLEDPMTALPYRQLSHLQPTLDVSFSEDPYHVADRLGRPMAIVRFGTRKPIPTDLPGSFEFNNPPIQLLDEVAGAPTAAAIQPTGYNGSAPHRGEYEWHVATNRQSGDATSSAPCPECPPVLQQAPPCVCGQCSLCLGPGRSAPPRRMRDEYICDGDDAIPSVAVDTNLTVHGLDVEDTVAHFKTEDGKPFVVPSNRVCIYAPRFAAVRKVHSFGRGEVTAQPVAIREQNHTVEASGQDVSSTTLQRLRLQANKLASRPGLFHDQTRNLAVESSIHLRGSHANFKAFEDLQLIKFGRYSGAESARLNLGMQSAKAWDVDVASQMTVKNAQLVIVDDAARLQEIVSVKSDHHPVLRLVKVASRIAAQPGDTIDFTIRFDNTGTQTIENVTIIDNLSPRLEFVEGSAKCTRDARLTVNKNDVGSVSLHWEITQPMAKGQGGVIQFQCRVR